MVLGVVLSVAAVVEVTLPLVHLVHEAPAVATPGSARLHLTSGAYRVFEPTRVVTGTVSLHAADVTVTGSPGDPLRVAAVAPDETITRSGQAFTSAVGFSVRATGDYEVTITAQPGQVLVTRSLADALRSRIVWLAAIPVGGLIFLGGLVQLILALVRRRRG